ncbi:PQQ-binding-like beta-propeller repeat protein [Cellulomonas sp. JZ18]|uniref:outer membrane protein assembly factor BamB family protein n=1 Tax=Cellulomonas sp. JZ18 TaxID=2654191 RepID=UPI0012D37FE4|nr:PQQ-binding-like beta-propeller repeat protein [Cellulomonas sp. JZ18]QGQ18153.1 PQQ-binding-like beta-propeller repeat protein [Cellulomonas sp. JZ18]
MGGERGTHDLELLEEGPDDAPGADPPGRRRPRPWTLVAAAALLLLALVVAEQVVDARERARLDRVLDVAGAVAPLPDALTVRWSPDRWLAPAAGRQDPRALVAVRTTEDGAQDAVAFDAVHGDVRWRVPLVPAPGERGGTTVPVGSVCATAGADRVVCLGSDAYLVSEGTSSFTTTTTTARVLVVETGTGAVVAEHDARLGDVPAHAMTLAGDTVVLHGTDAARASHVWAVDVAGGAVLWSTALPDVDVDVLSGGVGAPGLADVATLPDGTVAVLLRDGSVLLLDPADGRPLRDPVRGTAPADATVLPDGRVEVAVPDGEHADVLRADRDVRVAGRLLRVTVDDGSVPGVLLAQGGGRVRAVDDRTGEVRWEAPTPLVTTAALLGGRVHLSSGDRLLTLDGRTGAPLWEHERPAGVVPTGVLTDGTLLYEPQTVAGDVGRRVLVGLDPADGRQRRTVTLPPDVVSVQPWARLLVAGTGDRLLVLG